MKGKIKSASLLIKIMSTVLVGVMLITITNVIVVNEFSKEFFSKVYGQSQEKIVSKVKSDIESYMEDLSEMCTDISSSWNIRSYLIGKKFTPAEESSITYSMQRDFKKAVSSTFEGVTVLLVSKSGTVATSNDEILTTPVLEILKDDVVKRSEKNITQICFDYIDKGYTSGTKNEPALIGVKALENSELSIAYGYIVIIIPESQIESFYAFSENDYNEICLMDPNGKIVSSTKKDLVGEPAEGLRQAADLLEKSDIIRTNVNINKDKDMVIGANIMYLDYKLFFLLDVNDAINEFYSVKQLAFYTTLISLGILLIVFVVIRRTMKPLKILRNKMSYVREGDFSQHVEIKGSGEIEEVAETYNRMLDDINRYVEGIIDIEKEKRMAEIKALQMQINPHYIYNTLTGIKWLIMQGDVVKSTKAIDAFIKLLRSTISNSDEYVTIAEEIENLKNYIYINSMRYGDKINTEFMVSINEPEYVVIPKMLLQPFIENAFFHAFPQGQSGTILVSFRDTGDKIRIEIMDDGVGMNEGDISEQRKRHKGEHFTGIGINNIQSRLRLIYGSESNLKIKSESGEGTTIVITLPKRFRGGV